MTKVVFALNSLKVLLISRLRPLSDGLQKLGQQVWGMLPVGLRIPVGKLARKISQWTWRRKRLLVLVGVGLFLLSLAPSWILNASTRSRRYDLNAVAVETVPQRRVAIVFGAGANSDFTPTPYLQDRIDVAIELYKSGRVEKLLMSGDNGVDHYNEPVAMKNYAVKQGVVSDDVYMDYAGFSTYDTCYRAHEIFGLNEATLVTHGYHLPRAITTCDRLGVKSIGVMTHWKTEKWVQHQMTYRWREVLSTDKALTQLFITKPKPKFLGLPETIL